MQEKEEGRAYLEIVQVHNACRAERVGVLRGLGVRLVVGEDVQAAISAEGVGVNRLGICNLDHVNLARGLALQAALAPDVEEGVEPGGVDPEVSGVVDHETIGHVAPSTSK